MWLIDDDQIQVGARANLPPCERPDRAESDAGGRHVERHRGHRVTPQAAQAIHGELRSRPALRGATPVHAVSIRLAHVHEPLLEMIDRRTQDTPPSPNSAPQAGGCRWSRLEVVKPTRVHKTTLSLATRASSRQREQFQSLPSVTGGKDVDI